MRTRARARFVRVRACATYRDNMDLAKSLQDVVRNMKDERIGYNDNKYQFS